MDAQLKADLYAAVDAAWPVFALIAVVLWLVLVP